MNNWQLMVRDFMLHAGQDVRDKPQFIPEKERRLRAELHTEEVLNELENAMFTNDMEGIADGIGDAIYVMLGTACAYGIDLEPIFEEIHRANMAKLAGPKREDGKQLKPEGWEPPDIEGLLKEQGW